MTGAIGTSAGAIGVGAVGIDVGTTNVKVVLVDPDGSVAGATTRPLDTHVRRTPVSQPAVTQDASMLWATVIEALAATLASAPAEAATVASIGICSQYSSIVPVDDDLEPVGPMVMWQDRRGTEPSLAVLKRHPAAFERWVELHGIPPVGGGLALGHLLVLEEEAGSGRAESATTYLEPMDFIVARLTGTVAATQHTMFMSQLCDNRTLGARRYDDELLAMAGLSDAQLPPLVDVGTIVGTIRPDLAAGTGLPLDTVVTVGTNDTATDAIAVGASTPGRCGIAIGTTSVLVDTVSSMKVDLDHEILSMPGPLASQYLVWAENGLGGRIVQHLLESLTQADDVLGADRRADSFAHLDAALADSPAGAHGVLCLPWHGGSLAPSSNPSMRGGFLNVSLDTSRTDLLRAAVEATAHNLGWLVPHVEAFLVAPIAEAGFVGGAARSDRWCQILADVLARPVLRIEQPDQAVARAAALLSLHHRGDVDLAQLAALVRLDRTFEPDADLAGLYQHRQGRFEEAYAAVAPIVADLAGAPETGSTGHERPSERGSDP